MSERLPKELHLFHRGDTVAIMNKNRREVVAWTGFDSSDFPKCMRPKIARRIVATWNACAGIPTDQLEQASANFDLVAMRNAQATADEAVRLLSQLQKAHCVAYCDVHNKTHTHECQDSRAFLEARK